MFWFWRRRSGTRLLSLLHALLLLRVSLLQLLGLLLMALFELLSSGVIRVLSCEPLVFFLLPLLQFLPLFLLLCVHLFLLLLIFAVLPGVAGVWRSRSLERWQVIGMHGPARVVVFGGRIGSSGIAASWISRTAVNGAAFPGGHDPATAKCSWGGSCSNGRLAAIH